MTHKASKILHFIDSGGVYGAEKVILNLSKQMRGTAKYQPVVGCIVREPHEENDLFDAALAQGLDALKIPIRNSRLIFDLVAAAQLLKDHDIALIHSHGYKPSVFGFIIRMLVHIPVIATCHLWFRPANGPFKMRAMIWLEKKLYRLFPKVVAVSRPIRKVLLDHGVEEDKTTVVCNGVDVPIARINQHQRALLRQSLNVNDQQICVLNTGRLTHQKAQWILVEAAKLLKDNNFQIRVLIVGEGKLAPELRNQIERLDLQSQVSLLGFRTDIDQLLQACDVFALPSLDEGMPMSLLEAAALGCPIITTDVGDIGNLISNEHTGLIIPREEPRQLAKAIERLARSPELASRLGTSANQAMLKQYSSQAMCEQYVSIYDEVLVTKKLAASRT